MNGWSCRLEFLTDCSPTHKWKLYFSTFLLLSSARAPCTCLTAEQIPSPEAQVGVHACSLLEFTLEPFGFREVNSTYHQQSTIYISTVLKSCYCLMKNTKLKQVCLCISSLLLFTADICLKIKCFVHEGSSIPLHIPPHLFPSQDLGSFTIQNQQDKLRRKKNSPFLWNSWIQKKGWGGVSLYCLCSAIFYWKAYRFVSSRLWISFCFLASLCKDIYPMGLLKIKSYPPSARRTTTNSWADPAFSQRAIRQHQREKLGQNLCSIWSMGRGLGPQLLREWEPCGPSRGQGEQPSGPSGTGTQSQALGWWQSTHRLAGQTTHMDNWPMAKSSEFCFSHPKGWAVRSWLSFEVREVSYFSNKDLEGSRDENLGSSSRCA